MDYPLIIGENKEGKGGLVFGIRAGYSLSPIKGDWKMDEIEISNAPNTGITGPFVRLIFGGGEFENKE